ncbi:hypothetical protein ACFLYV_01360 [Chloroflexota bacterium]
MPLLALALAQAQVQVVALTQVVEQIQGEVKAQTNRMLQIPAEI